jgi:LytS/YehU family sensor histidine kinase
MEPDRLRLVVENTGGWNGGDGSGGRGGRGGRGGHDGRGENGGIGLANVRARLETLHPGEHRIEIEEAEGRVRVTVELPASCRDRTAT